MTAAEPLDPESTEPPGRTDWTDDEHWADPFDDDGEAWEPHEWLEQDDDDGIAEAGRWRRIVTIETTESVL